MQKQGNDAYVAKQLTFHLSARMMVNTKHLPISDFVHCKTEFSAAGSALPTSKIYRNHFLNL